MTGSETQAIADSRLQFFGEMTASISHEIKNCLAIMNESAGLLQDLVMMNRKGTPLDPDRLDRIGSQIAGQVRRADTIVKNLNSFAHSADISEKSVELNDVLSLSSALSQRFAVNRGFSLNLEPSPEKTLITTQPFSLLYVIWRCLDFAMTAEGPEKTVTVLPEINDGRVGIHFKNITALETDESARRLREEIGGVLEMLGGELHFNKDQSEMGLMLPA
jgi:signal transduction histidine kinase